MDRVGTPTFNYKHKYITPSPGEGMMKVIVYKFRKWDGSRDGYIYSRRKRTLADIRRLGGFPIRDTEEEVDESELDEHGRYESRQDA
jgi:hypothetical protein